MVNYPIFIKTSDKHLLTLALQLGLKFLIIYIIKTKLLLMVNLVLEIMVLYYGMRLMRDL